MKHAGGFILTAGLSFLLSCQPSNDTKIEKDVQSAVTILDPAIQVGVADGVVTLTGAVKDSTAFNTAASTVKELKGVKSVINNMTVK